MYPTGYQCLISHQRPTVFRTSVATIVNIHPTNGLPDNGRPIHDCLQKCWYMKHSNIDSQHISDQFDMILLTTWYSKSRSNNICHEIGIRAWYFIWCCFHAKLVEIHVIYLPIPLSYRLLVSVPNIGVQFSCLWYVNSRVILCCGKIGRDVM